MRAALEARPRGERPTLDVIAEALGGFSSTSDGTGEGARPGPAGPAVADGLRTSRNACGQRA
jgi:hypothetical protein